MKKSFDIVINGLSYRCNKTITVKQLIQFLQSTQNAIALEYNEVILKQEDWEKTILKANDKLEIVTIVGGG